MLPPHLGSTLAAEAQTRLGDALHAISLPNLPSLPSMPSVDISSVDAVRSRGALGVAACGQESAGAHFQRPAHTSSGASVSFVPPASVSRAPLARPLAALELSAAASSALDGAVSSVDQAVGSALGGALPGGAVPSPDGLQPHWGMQLAEQWLGEAREWASFALGAVQEAGPTAGLRPALEQLSAALASAGDALGALSAGVTRGVPSTYTPTWSSAAPASPPADYAALLGPVQEAARQVQELIERVGASLPADGGPAAAAQSAWAALQAESLGGVSAGTLTLITAGVSLIIAASIPPSGPSGGGGGGGSGGSKNSPDLPVDYSPSAVADYYALRPALVSARGLQVAREALAIGAGLLSDLATGGLAANAPRRAAQVRQAVERLGPAYVKVAQALSTRVDILSPAYLVEIERLQDQVPTFPDAIAMAAIEEGEQGGEGGRMGGCARGGHCSSDEVCQPGA